MSEQKIIDADRHVIEPIEMWRDYIEPEFRSRAPYLESIRPSETLNERIARLGAKALVPVPPMMMLEGRPVIHKFSEKAQIELVLTTQSRASEHQEWLTPEGHLKNMERSGIQAGFLYPTYAMYLLGVNDIDPALAAAFARAYNSWLYDFCSKDPERLLGVGLLSQHDPGEMRRELERIVSFGWRAIVLRPNPVRGRLLSHPCYEAIWSACEQHNLAVAIHEGTHTLLPTTGADRFETRFALHACSHPMEQMMAMLALIEGGVLERHPRLRVAFLEAGCGWLPYWLWRMDEEYKNLMGEVEKNVRRPPSAYFRRQCYIGFEPSEPGLGGVLSYLGNDHLLFGTDFPHLDHDGSIIKEALALEGRLPTGALGRLLQGNARRFYGIL